MTFAFHFFQCQVRTRGRHKRNTYQNDTKDYFLYNNINNNHLETNVCFTVRKITTLHIGGNKQRVKCKCNLRENVTILT